MLRTCERCRATTDDDSTVWCSGCGAFIGFASPPREGAPDVVMALLDQLPCQAEAGSEAWLRVAVRNSGNIVDQIGLVVADELASWVRVDPPAVSLFPGQANEVRVVVSPPRSPAVAAGLYEFDVVGSSLSVDTVSDRMALSAVVAPFIDVRSELSPQQSAGASGGTHRVVLGNQGNSHAQRQPGRERPGRFARDTPADQPTSSWGRARWPSPRSK